MQETSQDLKNAYYGKGTIEAEKIIVYLPLLLSLFNVCRTPNCGSACDPDDRKVHFSGAMVTISGTCNNGCEFSWKSSPMIGTGMRKVSAINILLGTFAYLCGVNVNKVTLK